MKFFYTLYDLNYFNLFVFNKKIKFLIEKSSLNEKLNFYLLLNKYNIY